VLRRTQEELYLAQGITNEYTDWHAFDYPYTCRMQGCSYYRKDLKSNTRFGNHLRIQEHKVCNNYTISY